ncbi:MAG: Gfo/Idh/MocA family oxidoreductase [Chloroflexi bacterium]|uniref:Gfo/Idh/MocA family protein n=1 Tax=Candidatus Flexifilum breve TaxID=3140694 RepID=UPI003135E667|nr:Gfo/Idh/MocA family oxidoreductase [Chloroflexota bacterium]
MDLLRVGIIGTGRISDLHAIEYRANPRAQIVAVADVVRENAESRGRQWGVADDHIFTDYHDLLALPDVDLVEILLPHHLHYQAALDAAAAKKHISLQKPMALTLAEADQMIAAAKQAGVIFKVFENFIFYPPVQRAKALIDAGEIGEPLTIRIKSNSGTSPNMWNIPRAAEEWRFKSETCGGGPLVFDDGHHKFALAWHFMGLAEEVHAWIGATEREPGYILDSPALVSWKFPNNRYGSLEVVYSPEMVLDTAHYAQDDRIEITGTRGVIWVTRGHGKMMDVPPVIMYRDRQTFTYSDMPVGWEHSFINSTRHFINAYHTGAPPVLTGEQGRDVLRFTLAAQASARLGQSVKLEAFT